ncbi:inactive CLIP domain-containing serine protease A3 [Anoplolepis gracilipes]|uniref:inactive CLIP domain-containing serine protease A3 n=1 Tax=Anoplolepis gracilipes TaxID=354296 RepID=UPI003B9F9D80
MNSILPFLFLCQLLQQICAQMNFETAPRATTAIVNNGPCLCYSGTTCPSGSGFDIRIVNTGTTCPSGQVYCCTTSGNSASCGIRKVPSVPHPPGQAAPGAYPWQVAITTKNTNDYLGGGVLIDPMYVLTAAHKVAGYGNDEIKAKLGVWDAKSPTSVDISISKVTLHPNYTSGNLHNDIAVLKLSSAAPIATNPNINTACLPYVPAAVGTQCWVTGWGKNAFGPSGTFQNILKEVDVVLRNQTDCQTRLRKTRLGDWFVLDNSAMCAGGEAGKDACTGDGGSPLVCSMSNGSFQVIGLVIWGIGCADGGVPGVYTSVPFFLPWITQQMT